MGRPGAVVVLPALPVRFGLFVKGGDLVLYQTIDFQTVVAKAAHRLLAGRPDETAACIADALAILGEGSGADHCYVLMLDGRADLWSRPGLPPPPGWPATQSASISDVAACRDDLVFVETARGLGPAALGEALTARGVAAWACARLRCDGRIVGLLCLERGTSRRAAWPHRARGFLQMVADSFGAALEREHGWTERREMEAALRRAQRLEAIGTFTSGVAHNINNVLNVMLGHAEIAADALQAGSPAALQIELLRQAGGRAREIAGQVLEFGRQRRVATRTSAIDEVVAETIAQLDASAGGSRLRVAGTAGGAQLDGEPAQQQQVVLNLLRNAAEASRADAPIDVRLDRVALARPQALSHGALRAGDHVRLRVTDTGRGMDAATLARIFEPFFTTRAEGTGLGLATAFEFVREHAGAFDVRSAPGVGSRFEVWLPVAAKPAARARAPAAGGTVMVVGRTQDLVERDEELMAALGTEPIGFADPEAALAALRAAPGRFDLLIVEGELDGVSGRAFARRAVAIAAKPVILSLASREQADAEDVSSAQVVGVTCRPWRSDALATLLSRHLARAPAASPRVAREPVEETARPAPEARRARRGDSEPTRPQALIGSLCAQRSLSFRWLAYRL